MAELEKVIKGIECQYEPRMTCYGCDYFIARDKLCNKNKIFREAVDLLKAQEPGWISVKDRLPVKNANVLWWCEIRDRHMGHVRIGFFEGVTNHDIPEVSCCAPNCIPMYWMPLPEPPKEETK